MRIYLIGFMAAGKTSNGKKLAHRLNYDFIDLDNFIENAEKMPVHEIFEQKGEDYFRLLEKEALGTTFLQENIVVSTGGGTPCYFDNMQQMNNFGLTIYFNLPYKMLLHRIKNSKTKRPLVEGKTPKELKKFVSELLKKRDPKYKSAKIIIERANSSLSELIDLIKAQEY